MCQAKWELQPRLQPFKGFWMSLTLFSLAWSCTGYVIRAPSSVRTRASPKETFLPRHVCNLRRQTVPLKSCWCHAEVELFLHGLGDDLGDDIPERGWWRWGGHHVSLRPKRVNVPAEHQDIWWWVSDLPVLWCLCMFLFKVRLPCAAVQCSLVYQQTYYIPL